jgi:hypothetical protein
MPNLTELRRLAEAATPGPWKWDGDVCAYDSEQEAPWLLGNRDRRVLYGKIRCDNSWTAELIAACSPERIIAMLDVIAAADAMRESCVLDIPVYDATRARLEEL